MAWQSMTGQFPENEMNTIESMSKEGLVSAIIETDALVALRILAEIMLNGDTEKLDYLLQDPNINNWWRFFVLDLWVNEKDVEYAQQLQKRLDQLKSVQN